MELKKFKTIDYNQFGNDVQRCLSHVIKKITNEKILSNIKGIKEMFRSYDQINLNLKNNNIELVKENKTFKNNMDKYNIYKKFVYELDKHKNKEKKQSHLENLTLEYIRKGYKVPNFSHNLFKGNPLNYNGMIIRNYFNELYKQENKPINDKEKNLFYLCKLQKNIKNIKNIKIMNSVGYQSISSNKDINFSRKESNSFESNKNEINNKQNLNNLILKSIYNSEKKRKEGLSEKNSLKRNTKNNNFIDIISDYKTIDENEDFQKLNDYEKKHIKILIKESQNTKKYNNMIEKIIKNKNFFKIIDNNEIEFKNETKKKKDITNKMKSSIELKNLKKHLKINIPNSEENSFSSENKNISSSKSLNLYLKNRKKNIQHNSIPNLKKDKIKIRNSRNIKVYRKEEKSLTLKYNITNNNSTKNLKNYIRSNKKFKKTMIQNQKNNKNKLLNNILKDIINNNRRNTYLINPNTDTNFLKIINEKEGINNNINNINEKKSNIKKYRMKILKRNNTVKYQDFNKMYNKIKKEENLNYLYNKINSQINVDEDADFINEFKNYFIKNKDMTEESLNNFINRKYNIKDFFNLCTIVDKKIKYGNIMNNFKKNYMKIGKLDGRKELLKEEGKQDYIISHLFQEFLNSLDGKRKFYEYQCNDFDLNSL